MTSSELALAAQAGNERALELLLRRHDRDLRRWTAGHYLQGAERDDLLQEARIGLLAAVRQFDPALGSFEPFARMVVIRKVGDAVKTHGRGRQRLLTSAQRITLDDDGDERDVVELLPSLAPSAQERIECSATLRRIVTHTRCRLSPSEREALVRHIFCGESYAEIEGTASAAGVKRVDNALSRARSKLRAVA